MIVTKRRCRAARFCVVSSSTALPLLDAMVPAFSVTARTAANPAADSGSCIARMACR